MSDDTRITVSRTVDESAAKIFKVLTLPANHVKLDGSGFVRSAVGTDRITGTGDVFTMNMEGAHMGGEYQTENHVVGYEKDKLLAWRTAPAGTEPPGWEWVWELEAQGPDQTLVTQTYDWSRVTDKELLAKNLFPLVGEDQLEQSLGKVAELVAS